MSNILTPDNLYDYQKRATEFVIEHPRCALWMDMGLGKTVSTLTALWQMWASLMVNRVLIVAPKRVAMHVWAQEVEKWAHLHDMDIQVLAGLTKPKRLLAASVHNTVHVINREMIKWLVDMFGDRWPYDTIVIDESSSFKNEAAQRFKALRRTVPRLDRVVELTGTPISNGYLDIWPQIYLLDMGERLGMTVTAYREQYFIAKAYRGFTEYTPRGGAIEAIQRKIADLVLRMEAADYLDLPEVIERDIPIHFDAKQRAQYKEFEEEFLLELENAEEDIVAVSAAALAQKLLQYTNGAVYDSDKATHWVHDLKIEALQSIREEHPDDNLLVAYNFVSDKERILEAFPEAVDIHTAGAIDRWNNGEIKMLVAHPASAGHGLNLQDGGRMVVWFGLNWSLELTQQFNGRLTSGLRLTKPAMIYRIVAADTIDTVLIDRVAGKLYSQLELLNAVKRQAKGHM